ncbi:hypothetical protein DQ04_15801000 [Trypanosoma grayi]|uniref:hypothetical protein n=1 Tax=Trypanosoma grayi TaxID=71804 RepID=UPI0004F42D0C|nr:hypothetical protein DQ04_15801000 [Trypanosoma grayi]KEG06124.1 hypothetical protein DQ04_15801000 [Trypanosoma grayi]
MHPQNPYHNMAMQQQQQQRMGRMPGGPPGPYGAMPGYFGVPGPGPAGFYPPQQPSMPPGMSAYNTSVLNNPMGTSFLGPAGCGPFAPRAPMGDLSQRGSILLGNPGSRGSFSNTGAPYGSLYGSNAFAGSFQNGPYGSYQGGLMSTGRMGSGFERSGSFQAPGSNYSGFGSAYGYPYARTASSGAASSNPVLQRVSSGMNFDLSFHSNASQQSYNNGITGIGQKPSETSLLDLPALQNPQHDGGLMRYNSMTLARTNSTLNGFYNFGPEAQMNGARRLAPGRLAGRPSAPPQWPTGGAVSTISAPPQNNTVARPARPPEPSSSNAPSSGNGELTRKGSEKRIGMYFKDVQPTQNGEYKKDGDPGTSRKTRTSDPATMTRVRTIVLLEKNGGNNIEVDGSTAIMKKPNSDELQKYDTNAILLTSLDDPEVFIEGLEELRDTFLMGCNVSLVMADSNCPAHIPSNWFTWNGLRRLMKECFAKMSSRSELSVSVSLLEDDQVKDLLDKHPRFFSLSVAQSPLFGNVPHGTIYQVVVDASEFDELLDLALSRANGREGEERGIVLVSAVLKQIRTNTPHTKGDEEDIVLSSLFASGVGDGIIHYTRILDKNPAEPRALFQFALGGPAMTAAVMSIADGPDNGATVTQFMATLHRLGEIENYRLRLGSVRRFITYTNDTIPKTKRRLGEMSEGREKEATKRSLARLELMVKDAEAMLESPENAEAKTYIRH